MAEIKYASERPWQGNGNGTWNSAQAFQQDVGKASRSVVDNPFFRAVFDPLGLSTGIISKFAPDDIVGRDINYGDFENKQMTDILSRMREYYARLGQPLDMNDPDVQRIVQMASSQAGRQASNQGIRGGLSVSNTQSNVGNALGQYSMDRQKMYMEGMSNLAGLMGKADETQYRRYADAVGNEQKQLDQLRSDVQQRNSGVMGLFGTVIGGLTGKPELGNAIGNVSGGQTVGQRDYAGGSGYNNVIYGNYGGGNRGLGGAGGGY